MPLLTLTAGTTAKIPDLVGRKAVVLYLETGDCCWGFDPVSHTGATRGIPLPLEQQVSFVGDSPGKTFAGVLHLASDTGCTLLYQQRG